MTAVGCGAVGPRHAQAAPNEAIVCLPLPQQPNRELRDNASVSESTL